MADRATRARHVITKAAISPDLRPVDVGDGWKSSVTMTTQIVVTRELEGQFRVRPSINAVITN